jgi:hypothetical protein
MMVASARENSAVVRMVISIALSFGKGTETQSCSQCRGSNLESIQQNEQEQRRQLRDRARTAQGNSLSLEWKKVRAGLWSGRDGEMMYTIAQTRGSRFYVTRDIKRSPFAMTRSLSLAKTMAQQNADERGGTHKACARIAPMKTP